MAHPHKSPRASTQRLLSFDPDDAPDFYAMRLDGTCLEPEIEDGTLILVSRVEPYRIGDFVVVYLRPEALPPSGYQAQVKRLVMANRPPKPGTPEHLRSNVAPCIVIEQLNPHRYYTIPWESVLAVHKCLGPVPANVRTYKASRTEVRAMAKTRAAERSAAAAAGGAA